MTKKAMTEKYTIMMDDAISKRDFYKDCLLTVINAYCTIEEIGQNSLRKLIFITLARSEDKGHIEDIMRNWGYLQKAEREVTILTQVICDLH